MEEKKNYEKPAMVVLVMDIEATILTGSGTESTRQDYGTPETNDDWSQSE